MVTHKALRQSHPYSLAGHMSAIWINPAHSIRSILVQAAENIIGSEFEPDVRAADPRFGDYQANGVLPAAKKLGRNPREIASLIVSEVNNQGTIPPEWATLSVAGPGFINVALTPLFLSQWAQAYVPNDPIKLQVSPKRTAVLDFSGPNTAKQMHVGHIRSTVIGEALARLLAHCGSKVIRDNHIGDWGTQFGIIIEEIKRTGFNLGNTGDSPLATLENLYKSGSIRFKEDTTVQDAARAELVKLQSGDPENIHLWEQITAVSYGEFEKIYQLLGINFDLVLGESFYRDKVDQIYKELLDCGLAQESEGALVVFHPEHPRFKTQPFIIRKSDGASNYATTDLATVLYRVEVLNAQEMIYVVDSRQSDHFEQLKLTVEKWFNATGRQAPKIVHVSFGTILGEDGKAIKTRSGESVKLRDLLNEAVERSLAIVLAKNAERPADERLSEEECATIAKAIGLGAVRYADLSQNRSSDYLFSWDKMLSLEGNTAPYLLYAVARLHSIYRRSGLKPGESETDPSNFETPGELALSRKLMGFKTVLDQAATELRPHFLCQYLYELAGAFSSFYKADKVMVDTPDIRARRLLLCNRTLRTLETGLHILGLETLERM